MVDRTKLDPGRLSLKTNFSPYEQVGETEVSRRNAGDLAEVRYRLRLRCLKRECITATLGTTLNPGGRRPAGSGSRLQSCDTRIRAPRSHGC